MLKNHRRRRQLSRVKPGDGSRLQPYRLWHLLTRSLFALELPDPAGRRQVFEVDVRHSADSTTKKSPASLYRDGVQVARSNLPASFSVPGGVVEVATSQYGLRRMHYVTDGGEEHVLRPHPGTLEGLRGRFGARFPRTSAAVGAVAVVVFLLAGLLTLMQGIDALTHSAVIARYTGTFTTPVPLSTGGKVAVAVAAGLAATERALTFRSRWLFR